MNKAPIRFGVVIFFVFFILVKNGSAQSRSPLIDSPGKTIGTDFNGDGVHDFMVGAYKNNDGGTNDEGAAYIFFGSSTISGTFDMGGVNSADVTVLGRTALDHLGYSVSAGDINGDGIDDLFVGSKGQDDGATNGGALYIFFGSSTISGTFDMGGVNSADVTFLGKATDDRLSNSVAFAGDVNGDGFGDIIAGARYNNAAGVSEQGAAYIFFGASDLSGTKDLGGIASPDVTILGKGAADDYLGRSVSGAGDVDGDGFDDVIIAAYGNDDTAGYNAGAAYIFFGASNLSGTKNLGGGESADFTVLGNATSDALGRSVSGAGDVNGDGFDDVIVGAHLNDDGGFAAEGAAYIFFGASNLSGTKDLSTVSSSDVTIFGKANGDRLGIAVSNVGDVNDDGFDDIIVGAYQNNDGGNNNEGAAYIIFGARNLSGTKDMGNADEDVRILGKDNSDNLGYSLSGVGDVNADGIPDIMVGAKYNNDGGTNDEGAAYIFFGSTTLSGTLDTGSGTPSEDVSILGRAATDNLGFSVGGGRGNPGP